MAPDILGQTSGSVLTRRRWLPLLGLVLALPAGCKEESVSRYTAPKAQPAVKEINLGGVKAMPPESWKPERPENTMRLAQFRTEDDVEIIIFHRIGGSAEDNIKRWQGQFPDSDGGKVTDINVGGHKGRMLDISGTYRPATMMGPPKAPRPGWRMLAVHIDTENRPFHVLLTGPAKAVEAQKTTFENWLKSFK